ncbi:MAG TPA: phosphoribosylanthranilate isomerase [Fulvivirga sp.]|nr:phosphoribosylanthranilate isomerase [Fulvivirga sp.]
MALKTFVKINSVNNLSDARYCAGMHVDLLGFDLDMASKSYIDLENFEAITGWTSGAQFVGEFGASKQESVSDALTEYEIDYVESNDISVLTSLKTSKGKILNISIDAVDDTNWAGIDYIIIMSTKDFTSEQIAKIKELSIKNKILLGSGVTADNIESILVATGAHGIALTAGDEIRPGYKDYDELADILEALEVEDWV